MNVKNFIVGGIIGWGLDWVLGSRPWLFLLFFLLLIDAGGDTTRNLLAARSMEYERAATFLDEGMRYADAIEQSHCLHMMAGISALVAWAQADWDGASSSARQTIADQSNPRATAIARWADGFVALGRGQTEQAAVELSAALATGLLVVYGYANEAFFAWYSGNPYER
mgnify:CR=1 FL=1